MENLRPLSEGRARFVPGALFPTRIPSSRRAVASCFPRFRASNLPQTSFPLGDSTTRFSFCRCRNARPIHGIYRTRLNLPQTPSFLRQVVYTFLVKQLSLLPPQTSLRPSSALKGKLIKLHSSGRLELIPFPLTRCALSSVAPSSDRDIGAPVEGTSLTLHPRAVRMGKSKEEYKMPMKLIAFHY